MRLFLLRCAEAAEGKKDAQRKLTAEGIATLTKLSNFLSRKELNEISEIRHSPLTRAKQTAKQFKKLSGIKAKTREALLLEPLADFRILADFLESSDETLLLVGHQDQLGCLGSYLLTRESDATMLDLKPGGMACLKSGKAPNGPSLTGHPWKLVWQIKPKMLS